MPKLVHKICGDIKAVRTELWRRLRGSRMLRRLSTSPLIGNWVRLVSYWMARLEQRVWCRVKGGIAAGLLFELSAGWEIAMWEGSYEREVQEIFKTHLSSVDVLYDVGANVGYFSCAAALLGAQVYAFEPNAVWAAILLQHARMNHLESAIELIPTAASSQKGTVFLFQPDECCGHPNSRVVEQDGGGCTQVDTTTLDDFVTSHPAPTVCKVDVEGYETEVLRVAEDLFSRVRPCLVCEIHDNRNEEFVGGWLARKGYARSLVPQVSGARIPGAPVRTTPKTHYVRTHGFGRTWRT